METGAKNWQMIDGGQHQSNCFHLLWDPDDDDGDGDGDDDDGDGDDDDDGDGDDDEGDMQNLRRKNKFSFMHLTDFCLSTVA